MTVHLQVVSNLYFQKALDNVLREIYTLLILNAICRMIAKVAGSENFNG